MIFVILILFFIAFTALALLVIRLIQFRADKLMEEAEANLNELFSEVQAKRVLTLTVASMLILGSFGLLITGYLAIGIIFGTLGYFLPRFYFRFQQNRRLNKFDTQLVGAIDMMANALKSGSNLHQAITLIKKEVGPPISQEFDLVLKEMIVGVQLKDAFKHMSERINSEELDIVVIATNIARDTGGNLAEVFDRIAKTIRDRAEVQGKIKAMTAEGKFQGIFVGALPFVLAGILTIMDPELMRPLYTTVMGYILIGIVIVMELIGAYFIKKIITIDV